MRVYRMWSEGSCLQSFPTRSARVDWIGPRPTDDMECETGLNGRLLSLPRATKSSRLGEVVTSKNAR